MNALRTILSELQQRRNAVAEELERLDAGVRFARKLDHPLSEVELSELQVRALINIITDPDLKEGLESPPLFYNHAKHSDFRINRKPSETSLSPKEIVQVTAKVLREAGRPMNRTEIIEELETMGISLPGKDRSKNLGTILWRNRDLFQNIDGVGYWFTEVGESELKNT